MPRAEIRAAGSSRSNAACVVLVRGRRVERGPLVDDRLHRLGAVEVDILGRRLEREIVAVAEHLALAGRGENDELVAEVAADRAGFGPHRNGGEAEAGEGAQVGGELLVVGMARAGLVEVEGVGVLHQEFARAHHAEARPHLVAELPLDVIEIERQILVGAHRRAEDFGDHLLVGRPVQHVAVVPVADAQHLLAVIVVAPGFAPEIGRLDGRHQDLDRAGAVLLLADDGADLVQDPDAERQPGVAARRLLADHAGAQHEPMRDDLRLFGRLLEDRQEIAGETHGTGSEDANRAGSRASDGSGLMASSMGKGQAGESREAASRQARSLVRRPCAARSDTALRRRTRTSPPSSVRPHGRCLRRRLQARERNGFAGKRP